jgi:uncharacterized protein (UPF0276 family)
MRASAIKTQTIPARAGIGLRGPHYQEVLSTLPAVAWWEVHSENFFADGGASVAYLDKLRRHYPLSLHGVGLSLGSTDPLNITHLAKLKRLVDRCEPGLVSEHLSWSSIQGRYLNDLVPLPYTEEALAHVSERIRRVQGFLERQILIENVSSYLQFAHSTIPEWEFLAAVARDTGCGLLLDINNIYVNAVNHGFDPYDYLRAIDGNSIGELHLAGFTDTGACLIDTHSAPVCAEVWELYEYAIRRYGAKPTLIEWDLEIPSLRTLVNEAQRAQSKMEASCVVAA